MARKWHRYRLLLDENFPTRDRLPRLNHRFDLKHLVLDLHQSGISDLQIYKTACRSGRLIVTFNDKDFRNLAQKDARSDIIGISANVTTETIDKKLTSLLMKTKPKQLYGHFYYVSGENTSQ